MASKFKTPLELATEVAMALDDLTDKISRIDDEIVALLKAGVAEGKPNWREGKYLYLAYPPKEDGTRFREYIGCDPKRIADALARVERFARWIYLRGLRDDLQEKHRRGWSALNSVYWSLKASQKEMAL